MNYKRSGNVVFQNKNFPGIYIYILSKEIFTETTTCKPLPYLDGLNKIKADMFSPGTKTGYLHIYRYHHPQQSYLLYPYYYCCHLILRT